MKVLKVLSLSLLAVASLSACDVPAPPASGTSSTSADPTAPATTMPDPTGSVAAASVASPTGAVTTNKDTRSSIYFSFLPGKGEQLAAQEIRTVFSWKPLAQQPQDKGGGHFSVQGQWTFTLANTSNEEAHVKVPLTIRDYYRGTHPFCQGSGKAYDGWCPVTIFTGTLEQVLKPHETVNVTELKPAPIGHPDDENVLTAKGIVDVMPSLLRGQSILDGLTWPSFTAVEMGGDAINLNDTCTWAAHKGDDALTESITAVPLPSDFKKPEGQSDAQSQCTFLGGKYAVADAGVPLQSKVTPTVTNAHTMG